MDKKSAYERVKDITRKILNDSYTCVFKKVDSTLRGNIAEEVKAVCEVYEPELIIFAPAYPSNDRITKDGIQFMNGVPVSQTEIGRDPKKPVLEDNIVKILQSGFVENVLHISLQQLRNGEIDFSNIKVLTFDAVEDENLVDIVKYIDKSNKKVLWVGSAGLANAIMEVYIPLKPVLAVVGSISGVSGEQVRFAESKSAKVVKVDVAKMLKNNDICSIIQSAVNILEQGQDAIVVSSYIREEYEESIRVGKELGMTKEEVSTFAQAILGQVTEKILNRVEVSGLFLTGGDTAIEVIQRLGARGTKILKELAAGIPLIKLKGGAYDGTTAVTKAGAFGEIHALDYCIRKIKEAN